MANELRLALYLGLAAVLFALGFGAKTLQSNETIAKINAAHSDEKRAAYATALAAQTKLDERAATVQDAVATIDATQQQRLSDALQANQRMRDCINRGTCGVRVIGAKCPAPSGVPGTSSGAGVDSGGPPILTADGGRDVSNLRDSITYKERQLAACQAILKAERLPQ